MRALCSAVLLLLAVALPVQADTHDRRIVVDNQSDDVIVELYGSNKGTNSWEEDILGTATVPSGESVTVNLDDGSGYCKFDFKLVFDDGSELIHPDYNVCAGGGFTITESARSAAKAKARKSRPEPQPIGDRRVQFKNRSGVDILAIVAAPSADSNWDNGIDLLGTDVLSDDDSVIKNVSDGTSTCKFDIKVIFVTEDADLFGRFDACQASMITIEIDTLY